MPPGDPGAGPGGSTRRRPDLLLVAAAVLLVARVALGVTEQRHAPRIADVVAWRPVAGAEAEAAVQRKPVLYDFTADWCAPCHEMQRELFADPEVARELEHTFVPVRVLDRAREEGRNTALVDSLERRFRVTAFPTLVVVPHDGGDPIVIEGYPGRGRTLQRLREARARLSPPGMPIGPGIGR